MSEDKTPAVEETVSETPATETPQSSPNDELIAESKKYRKRAQEAETRLAELETKFTTAEDAKLKKKEEYKTLYEKASSENEGLTANAEKWKKYEQAKRESLITSHPEEDRDSLSKLDLETLEFVTNKINNAKSNAPEVAGNARSTIPDKPVDWSDKDSVKKNWENILQESIKSRKQNQRHS